MNSEELRETFDAEERWVREHKAEVIEAANDGDATARQIITAHQLCSTFYEDVAATIFVEATRKFRNANARTKGDSTEL